MRARASRALRALLQPASPSSLQTLGTLGSTLLTEVDLGGCWRLSDAGMQRLVLASPSAQKVLLAGQRTLTDAFLVVAAASWTELRTLDLPGASRGLSAAGVAAFIRSARRLVALRLSDFVFTVSWPASAARARAQRVPIALNPPLPPSLPRLLAG